MQVYNGSIHSRTALTGLKQQKSTLGRFLGVAAGVAILATFLLVPTASAEFDHIFFSVNGDTTLSTMTQGDLFAWGSNCDSGATINWEIWYDANSNSTIDPTTDFILTSENITDGDPGSEEDPILDGYVIVSAFRLSGEPGEYIFQATDISTDSSIQAIMTMVAMPSPPNQFTGQIVLPGITPPNALLANNSIYAESDTGEEGIFLAMTDNMGMYSMNVGDLGTGVQFYLSTSEVTGFVAPDYISAVASGVVGGNDFTYTIAADSMWGFVRDDEGALLSFETSVGANSGGVERRSTTIEGRYAIYFTSEDSGEWYFNFESSVGPVFLAPSGFSFNLDTVSSFQHDITVTRTDAVIYARVTENGGPPANNYRVEAYSNLLQSYTETVSGTGSDNLAELRVSSLDPGGWLVYISTWDDQFPIPWGFVLQGEASDVAPGDTVTLNLVDGHLVSGTITQDPEDAPIVWDNVWVGLDGYSTNPDGGGGYALYAAAGSYYLGVYAEGYVADPAVRYLDLTGDTTSGLDFIINETHCRVTGTLTNVPLPLDNSFYAVAAYTATDGFDGYAAMGQVDSVTGTYELYLCEGEWTIFPPCCFPDLETPDTSVLVIGEYPDTARTLDFEYTPISASCCIPPTVGDLNQSGAVDITDIQIMIDHQYITLDPLVCVDEGDVNIDGGVDITDLQIMIDNQYISLGSFLPCP